MPRRRAQDRVGMGKAVRTYVYRIELTKESQKSWEHVTQRGRRAHRGEGDVSRVLGQTAIAKDSHEAQEHTMSRTTQDVKHHAKARQRRRRPAQERLARDRRQAQQATEALQQALDALGLPEDLVTEIEGRLRSQHKLLGKIVGVMCPPLFGCRTNSELCRVRGWDKNLVRRESGK